MCLGGGGGIHWGNYRVWGGGEGRGNKKMEVTRVSVLQISQNIKIFPGFRALKEHKTHHKNLLLHLRQDKEQAFTSAKVHTKEHL